MKKPIITFILMTSWALTSNAAISISWFQQGIGLFIDSAPIPADHTHVLVWSTSAPAQVNYAQPGTGIGDNEWALITASGGIGGQFSYDGLIFTDTDVGGNSINSGYVYSRIFQANTITAGDRYFQSPTWLGPTIPLYVTDPVESPPTDHNASFPREGQVFMDLSAADVDVFTVVPEPSVMALMGLGGLLMAIRRRRMIA